MVVVPRHLRSKDKIFEEAKQLRPLLQGLRLQNKTVVLTNGVFDLLHVGHMRALEDARARADFLVVAVNDDASTEANKGKGRPILPLDERMELLSGFWFVDYVTSFAESTADAILELLAPDFYAKGTDYTAKTLPERDTLKRLGIKPVFVGDKKDHSTTKLLAKIRRKKGE
ncbi:MAG: adenylyltransferase/cytidyltransferase family protein [Planctomycetota bacterium]